MIKEKGDPSRGITPHVDLSPVMMAHGTHAFKIELYHILPAWGRVWIHSSPTLSPTAMSNVHYIEFVFQRRGVVFQS